MGIYQCTGNRRGRVGLRALRRAPVLAVAALACLVGAAAAQAAPSWRIESLSNTTAQPGGTLTYLLQFTNLGDAPAGGGAGAMTFRGDLPSGVTPVSVTAPPGLPSRWDCSSSEFGTSGGTVQCVDSSDVISASDLAMLNVAATIDGGAASGIATARFQVAGGGALDAAATVDPTRVQRDLPGFGLDAFDMQALADASGAPSTQAGAHPYAITTSIDFNTVFNPNPLIGDAWPVEPAKDVLVDLPPGVIGNPTSVAQCSAADLAGTGGFGSRSFCPPTAQVGTVVARYNGALSGQPNLDGPLPLYNVVPPPNEPAKFGFIDHGTVVTFDARLRSDGNYGISVDSRNLPEGLDFAGTTLTFWGVPADPVHDPERACPGFPPPSQQGGKSCSSGAPLTAFLRNPTACTEPGTGVPTTVHLDSWVHPDAFEDETFFSHEPPGYPFAPEDWGPQQGLSGCDEVPFDPSLTALPTSSTRAGQPAAFSFDLQLPQSDDPHAIGEGDLRKAVVQLPEGVAVSPLSADGLGACTTAQIGLLGTQFAEPPRIRFSAAEPACPDNAKIGAVTVTTPLLARPLTGSVFLAAQGDNPFGSLLAVYIVAEGSGVILKLPGLIETDPLTGRLRATFDDNPQLPFSDLKLEFKGGPRAPLVAPDACGTYQTDATLTSWSGKQVDSKSTFTLSGDSSTCPRLAFSPTFHAGTENPVAGASTPFHMTLTRGDGDQQFKSLTVYTPTGLLGRIKSAQQCSSSAAVTAACPAGSQIGSATVGAGAGSNPFYITDGKVFLTGPYKGAPYGLAIVVHALAGPFDLGNVVVRAAIYVDRRTAALKVVSDAVPDDPQGRPAQPA